MLLSDDVTYQFVLSSVVSKHLLLALSVLCLFVELTIHSPIQVADDVVSCRFCTLVRVLYFIQWFYGSQ